VSTRLQWHQLLTLIRNQYPALVPIYLSQAELLRAVHQLRARLPEYVVRVRGVSAREGLRSVREWTDEELETALEHISDRRQRVSSLEMAFHRRIQETADVSPAALCKLTKRSEVEVSGAYSLVRSAVLDYVVQLGATKLGSFANRGLRDRQYSPAPLAIVFKTPVLKELVEVRRFVSILSSYPHSMHAVQHGNPYAHVRVADVYDGSSFDVWAVSGDRIAVIPGLKATEAASGRLINYVFEQFREGEVEEYGPTRG